MKVFFSHAMTLEDVDSGFDGDMFGQVRGEGSKVGSPIGEGFMLVKLIG